ncbi:STAR9 protein, partial [Leucopsar rothschildi]|nr:STAR9 protein [Leucopsar rothschildi]
RERAEGGRVIVEVDDKVAKVRSIKVDSRLDSNWDSREKTVAFSFDYCYWSVDPEDPKYASQEMVFQDLGTSVLSGAFRGYNICLFAYGQTGSGKTYTMMGTPASIGLTPRICEGLFSRKDDYSDQMASCRVKVSFLEIYNERVRDLLKQSDRKKPYTLRVREHPETGPYVQGLTHHLVTDYKQVVKLLEEGIAKRITAATHIHNASSRSHAIFTIHYTQAILENNLPSEIASKINLVDLAGSERADPSYCKDRITEGANINKSLVTLGIVISTLAQNSQMFSSCQSINSITSEGDSSRVDSSPSGSSSGSRRPAYIPYRDSILTWLLKDSLGGNSKTIMIATISPASSSYNETMSTLRYAANAKNIINKPRVNEDANVKLIRELREEIDRLKAMLMSFELIEQLTKDWTNKWTERKAIMEEYSVDINKEKAGVTIDSNLPHLMAMDDDILSTGVVLYHLREGTTKIGRSDSDQDQDIVLQGQWIERNHCRIENRSGVVTLRPVPGARCSVNGCPVSGSCRLSQGALVVLGKSHKFRFNHPAEAAILRLRRSINETPPTLSCGALDWLNLDGSCINSTHHILSSLHSREIDAVHEEYKQKLRDLEAFHRKQIQRQQLYVEDLKQQILRGQIKAEQEIENDQALINQQIQENQQWLINENKRLAALQQQQREFAVQTESTLCAEAEVQSPSGLETCLSLLQQNKKRLVQLELLQRYSLKKAERNIRRKKVKFRLERIVKKQKLLEAKQNLEQLEASCWLSEECVKPPQVLSDNIAAWPSLGDHLQKRQKSSDYCFINCYSYLQDVTVVETLLHSSCKDWTLFLLYFHSCFPKRESVSKLSTSPNIDQYCKGSTTERLSPVEYLYRSGKDISGKKDSNDSAIMAYINKNHKRIEKLDDTSRQAGSQNHTSKCSSPDLFKEKDEPKTLITGRRMTKSKVLGDLSQPASSNVAQNKAQVSNKKIRTDINGKGHRSSPENFPKQMKKTVYGNPPSLHLNQTVKNWKREANSALPSHERSSVEQKEFLMAATSVGNLTKMNSQTPLSYVEKKWHSAEILSAGVSKTATDVLGNWQEDDENEISDTDSSYSVDSLSCAYVKVFPEKLKMEDFDRNKCLANPEDSESDDSQMSQDSLIEKENKAKKQNTSQFYKLKAHHEPAKLYKSRTENHISSLVTSYASRRRLGKAERSFSLDSLADGEEMPAEDLVEESKSDSSDEVPAEIFWKLQTPKLPATQIEEDHESKTCNRDAEGTNYDLKLSSSFYLNTKPQTASSNACRQLLKGTKVSFVEQERSLERKLYYTSGNPLHTNDAWSSCDSKVDTSNPRITASSSHENLEFQDAHLCSLSKPELWLKKDDLKQSAAEVSFVSGSKQIHSITHSPHVNRINSVFSSDTLEVPLPETTAASGASESGSLNKIFKGWTNSNENSSLKSQNVMSSFVSSVGPSSSFIPTSAEHDYHEHSRSQYPEQEQLGELSAYKSATERAETFSCLESTSTAGCLSLVSKKEESSLPTTHPELPKNHTLKKTPFISVLPVHVVEQRNGCVDADLEDDLVRTFSKDELDNDYNILMTKSSVTDSGSGSASVSAPDAECSMGLAHSMTPTQTSAVKHIQFGNCGQLFPVQKIPTCCNEGFFLSDLTNKSFSLVSSYNLQTLAGQGAEPADTEEPPRSGESNLETMQEIDREQTPAEVAAETDFSSQKTTYQRHPLVAAASASYDQSATPIEMSQKERICMEISTDSLADIVPEVPSFRDHEEYIPKDEGLSSLNHYEFKPDSKDYSPDSALADNQASCLSQQISENYTLCTDNIREESSESKEQNVLNSQAVVQKEFSSKYKNLVVNEVSYFLLNANGKNTKYFPAAICENTNDFLPESNSSLFYKVSTKANLFQSASETENYDKPLEHATIVKGDRDATSNLTVEVSVTESCSDAHSGCLCPTCSSKSTGQKNTTHKTTDTSAEFDASVLLETETQNKSLLESRKEKETFFESNCPEDIFCAEHDANTELGRVFECNTNTSAAISQEERLYKNKESKIFRNKEMDPEEATAPYQNTGTARDEEIIKSINNASDLEKNALEKCIKSRNTESLPDRPVAQVQSVTEDTSGKNFKDIGLIQNPKKPTDIAACEVLCEFNTNLCLTHEEVDKDELQEASTGAEHTQESKALVHSDSQLETSSFCQKGKSEKRELGIYSIELSVAPKTTPSAVCSHTTGTMQNTLGFLDTCKGLLQTNGATENVAEAILTPGKQGNISAKIENEGQINSNSLIEHCVPNCLPQEDKVNEGEVTGSEEQISTTNTEEPPIMRQEDICTEENVYFNEQSPALHQMYGDKGGKEEILDQFKIPERYLMASEVELNILLEDDSRYHDPTEMSEDGDSVDSATEIENVTDACEYSVYDSADIDQYRTEQKFTSLDRHMYMSCSVQSPQHGTSKNLNVGIIRRSSDICELDQVGSRAEEEKVQLMKPVEMAKADKQKELFVENTEEVELIFLENLDELFPENKGSCQMTHDDSRLDEILRESQWISTSFSGNNEDISKQQNPPASQKCTEKNQELQDSPCQSVNQPLHLGGSDDSHLAQDVPTALKGCTKPSNSNLGTGAVLPYYETLMESEIGVGTSVTANKMGEDEHLPGVGKTHSLLESSTQKIFQNTTQKVPHLGASSVHDEKTFLSANYPTANSKCENAGVAGCQHEPTENQEHGASEERSADPPGNTVSEKALALSEDLIKSPKENPHYSKDFLNYNRNLGTSEPSPGLLNCPASSAGSLIVSNGDKGKNNIVLSEETKYFESESTDLSVSVTFPGVSQKGDRKENNSAVAEATYAPSDKLPEKVVRTEQKEKIVQGYFQSCGDIKDKIHEFSEHCSNTDSVTVPESGLLTFQTQGQTGHNESKALPSHSAEDTPPRTTFQSSKKFGAFNTSSLLGDSKSLVFSQLENSLQDSCLTEKVSCNSADVCSAKEGDFSQSFARVNYPALTAFSKFPLTANIGHGETSTCDTSHSNILKQSPFAALQDTQSDKAVVFDEPVCASGSILLSLAKENRHFPMSDIDCTSYENYAVNGESAYGNNNKKPDSDTKIDQFRWDKVPPQEACNKHIEKIPNGNSLLLPSLPFWDTRRAIPIKEGQMRNTPNRSKEELHSNIEAEHFAVKTEQRKTLSRESAEKQTNVSSNSPNELTGSEVTVLENLYPRDVQVDPEYTCNSFSPAYPTYRSPNPRQPYHTVLGFERNSADLQDNCQYGPAGNHDLTPQESKLVQLRSKRSYSTTRSTKGCKQSERRPYLQSHRVSAPAIAVFSDTEYTLEASSQADPVLHPASKSLQDLNMSVEPPSPTEDDFYGTERFSKQESKKFLQVKSKPRFQQKIAQTKKLANCDPKNLQNFAARSQSSQSLKDSASQSPSSLLPTAHSSVCAEANVHSKSGSVAQCSEGKGEEAGYQTETDLFLQDNKDVMHFRSSDINPYIHPWQQDGACKIGWKQYVFGSASDVSCNQIPLNMENRKVMRCSSVDNGLNSQNSPFHSHLSSYATAKVLSSTLSSIEENNTAELENPSTQPGNSSMQVDEIVLLYPSESEKPSKKPPGTTREQGTQTATTGRYKRQRRHQRSYTDVSTKKEETNRDLFHQHSSWTSMQNLSMHLSQLLQNTSELLGNLSQQSIIDNKQNAKINQKVTEGAIKALRSDSCTQTTADVGTQTEILEKPQSRHEEKQAEAKMENELRAAQAVNVDWKEIGADTVGEIPKKEEETPSLEERTQEQTGVKSLGNSDFHDSLDSILEDSFMHLPCLPKTSTPTFHFQKPSLNAPQNVAFASTRASPLTSSLPSSGQDGSSCTVVSSPTNSTSQSPLSYTQDKRSVSETETPAERKFWYKNTLLVDRASSPILTLSASPSSQTAFSKSVCPIKEPLGYSSVASSPLHTQRKLRAGQFSMQHHVDSFSQTETDSESSTSREPKRIRKKSGTVSDKKAAKELLGQDGSRDSEQQHRLRVDTHTTICAERLYHSSSTLEVSGHSEVVTGDVRDQGSVAHSLHCIYPSPNADLFFNQKISATCSSKTNAGTSSEPLVEASSLQFHDFFWKNENSCPAPLSDVSDVQTSFHANSTDSVTGSECDTEIPLSENTTLAKPYRPRSYSLRDLPIHNKFSNWCGVKSSPPPLLLGLSGSVSDLRSQAEKKPGSTQSTEMEGNYQSCDSRSREIKRLQRERAQIMSSIHLDLHQHPLTVELTEAKLNYGIGETDALLRVLQRGAADEPGAIPVKQQLYERHMRTIETLRKERVKKLQRYQRSRSLSPQKHLSLSQTLDARQRDLDLPSRRREYLQKLRRDVVENTRVQEPKRRNVQHPSDIELLLRDYQRAREETKTEIARARDKLRERAEQEKRRIREQIFSQLQKEEARLKTLASTSTLCTDSSLSLSSGPTSGYNSSNTATYTASNFSSQEGQVSSGNTLVSRDTRGRSAVRNSQLYTLEQLHKDSTFEASGIQPLLPSSGTSCRFTHGLTISVNSSSTKGYQDLSKHILANATTEVMAACSHNLRNLYTRQAA